jgi:hypothetical protein
MLAKTIFICNRITISILFSIKLNSATLIINLFVKYKIAYMKNTLSLPILITLLLTAFCFSGCLKDKITRTLYNLYTCI